MDFISAILAEDWWVFLLVIVVLIISPFIPKIKGYFGEKTVAALLATLNKDEYKIINNIMLMTSRKTHQIDHLVVSDYGIFVIETKNYSGWITGNEQDEYWRQTIYKRKERLYNPIRQNYGHVMCLKEVLKDFPEINYIPIVIFTTKADLKVTAKSAVIYTVNLIKTIKKYDTKTIKEDKKNEIYRKLLKLNIDNKDNRKAHVQSIHEKASQDKEKVQKDICPRCGGKLVLRNGKYGEFKGCSNFPKCRYTAK
ncbi:NERD domain-containing protein [Clostridium sp. 19966]|uniref:NERD domain-containing protein n=1 Tax=Clostridium sp. 19966 TaxID=2768166 RepID=UPI0028DFF06F|nr:NERD domain-containing protein [Clostridium sp. 19966]MDT8718757.1 NERD domain-containing protein [Clostridium sp. 19966]